MRQPKLLRTIRLYKMVKPFCFTLNESDGNSSVRQIPNDTAAGHPEALPLFESAWWHFQMGGPVGVLLRWTEIEFFKFKKNTSWRLLQNYKLGHPALAHGSRFQNSDPLP